MSHRIIMLCGIYGLLLIAGAIVLWGWLRLKAFLRSTSSISDQFELDELKRVVKADMYLAVAIIVVLGSVVILGAAGLHLGVIEWRELRGLLVLGPVCALAGAGLIAAEDEVRKLPLDDESLREDFDHIVRRWTSSMFPDW